ncbi:trypsin-like cysteine/serine peptidase domain-containing protein [Hypoxylon crocopeplum]|nr:trypsin-like cysteine/serine peptidase domain-containing protein [Hypoxylon crocopeplum]
MSCSQPPSPEGSLRDNASRHGHNGREIPHTPPRPNPLKTLIITCPILEKIPLPSEELSPLRQRTQSPPNMGIKTILFMDLLFTPRFSTEDNLTLMRRYQLLSGIALQLVYAANGPNTYRDDQIDMCINEIENAIEKIGEAMKPWAESRNGKVQVLWQRPLTQSTISDIKRVIRVRPIEDDELTAWGPTNKTEPYPASEETRALHKHISQLDCVLSIIRNTRIGMTGRISFPPNTVAWYLDDRGVKIPPQTDVNLDGDEVFFPNYKMAPVGGNELRPGGRFRGIVKLRMSRRNRFGVIVASTGTGCLLNDNTVVTAGHCVLRRGQRPFAIQVVVGYGRNGEEDSRWGSHVVSHWGWFRDYARGHDLALIRVNKFDNEVHFNWKSAPTRGDVEIFVAGYPSYASEELKGKDRRNEVMQKSEGTANCWRITDGMIRHKASTWNGSSGSPILHLNDKIIAIHSGRRFADDGTEYNAAAALDLKLNNLDDMQTALEMFETKYHTSNGNAADAEGFEPLIILDRNGEELFRIFHM